MSELKGWREIPIAGVTWKSSMETKTGDWKTFKPVIDQNKCIKCLICWISCPDMAIQWNGEKVVENYDYCKGCGICANVCPVKAIKMVKEE
ncbi:MAG: 4Fe-4S binding protein [archaeon GB-1867-097]|nr:4Fe-4S binding protein [Candidatus Verstraetearchaeota archaeon]MCS7373596.1 4Fe-4S binding protein [Candidatus Culexmicrobium thermophilum]MCS7384227.1 4Fe-4S binding protein [Candidatus Culexmicrobium thermophilum]RLE55311.1 MAG: pyruvate ferredoxin oxidoreductase [Candidatus Verstraetearchaeota archaeon]HDO21105.1 4Fe-4S dicluster domain-containing protein [Candidatus Bathyarchaeota archaeon]